MPGIALCKCFGDRGLKLRPGLPGPLQAEMAGIPGAIYGTRAPNSQERVQIAASCVLFNFQLCRLMLIFYAWGDLKVLTMNTTLPLRRLATFDTVIRTLGGTARTAEMLGISSAYVSNWKRVSGKIPAKYYLVMRDSLAEMGFEPADTVFNFVRRVRKKRRSFYCDFAESNVIVLGFPRVA
jgi:hypothetical protein